MAVAAATALAIAPVGAGAQVAPQPAPVVDPAREAAATRVVAVLVPQGIYARMMREQMPRMMDVMMAQIGGMRPRDLAPGLPAAAAGEPTLGETMRSADPHFDERTRIMTRVMSEEFATVFGELEPRVRTGLGHAFARKFTLPQLTDMATFFATPSGKAFGDEFLLLFVDPELMREMMAAMPTILQAMPRIMTKVEAATRHLPPPPKPKTDTDEKEDEK